MIMTSIELQPDDPCEHERLICPACEELTPMQVEAVTVADAGINIQFMCQKHQRPMILNIVNDRGVFSMGWSVIEGEDMR